MTIIISRKNPNQAFLWLLAGFLGLCFAYTYFFQYIYTGGMSKIKGVFLFLLLIPFFTLLVYGLVYKYAFSRIIQNGYTRRGLLTWFSFSCLSGFFLALVIPIGTPKVPVLHRLEVIATGKANPQALGNEVRLVSVFGPDGKPLDFSIFTKQPGWQISDHQLITMNEFPTKLEWRGLNSGDLKLVFLTHPWSGEVKIEWNDQIYRIDLYTNVGGTQEIILPYMSNSRFLRKELFLFTTGFVIGVFLFITSAFLVTQKKPEQIAEKPSRRWGWLVYTTPMVLVWTVYLSTFWPGLMSPDSFDQWLQSTTGNLFNVHPAAHTLTILLLRKVWDTPAIVALFQILTLSITAGVALLRLENYGANRKILFITALIFAFTPINSGMSITLWKDVLYSVSFMGVMICTIEIVFTNGRWVDKSRNLIILIFISLVLSLYRHNGLPVAAATFLGFLFLYPHQRKRFFYGFIILIASWFIVTRPIYSVLKVKSPTVQQIQIFTHYISAHLIHNTFFTEEEIAILRKVMPLNNEQYYSCFNSDDVYYSLGYNHLYATRHSGEIARIFLVVTLRKPSITLGSLLCVSNNTWRIRFPPGSDIRTIPLITTDDNLSYIPKNDFGITHESLLPKLEPSLVRLIAESSQPNWIWLAWRPALYLYILLLGVIVKALRERNSTMLYISLPVIFQAGVMFFLSINQELRLHYPIVVVSLIYSIYLILDPNMIRRDFAKSKSTL